MTLQSMPCFLFAGTTLLTITVLGSTTYQPFTQNFCKAKPFDKYLSNTDFCKTMPRGHLKPFGSHLKSIPEIPTLDEWPDPETFYRDYLRTSTPLLVRNEAKKWPAYTLWRNMTYFRQKFGNDRHDVLFRFVYDKYHSLYSTVRMNDFLDIYKTENVYMDSTTSNSMLEDCYWPKMLDCDVMYPMVKQFALFMNKGGSSSPLHADATDTFMTQVTGSRQWLLVKPNFKMEGKNTYSKGFTWHGSFSPINMEAVDFEKYPLAQNMELYNVTVHPGDTIYVPETWYHQVRAYGTPNIGVAIFLNFLWCELLEDLRGYAPGAESCSYLMRYKRPKEVKCNNTIRSNMTMQELTTKYEAYNSDTFTEPRRRDNDPGADMTMMEINNGQQMPAFGFGVSDCASNTTYILNLALKTGYRMFQSEANKAQALLGKLLKETTLEFDRTNLYHIVSIHPRDIGYQPTMDAIQKSLSNLQIKTIDLVILEAPSCDGDWFKCNHDEAQGTWKESWRALREARERNFVNNLGIGHFSIQQIKEIMTLFPGDLSVVHNRYDPVIENVELRNFCKEQNLTFIGHSITGERLVKDGVLKKNLIRRSRLMSLLSYKYRTWPAGVALHYAMVYKKMVATFHSCDPIEVIFNWQATKLDTSDDPSMIKNMQMFQTHLDKVDLVVYEKDIFHQSERRGELTNEKALIWA